MTDADEFSGDLRTTYVSNLGSGVYPTTADLVLGVIRYEYDFVGRTVDRNCPVLAPPKTLLDQFKRVEEAAESDGVPDPARAAWDSVNVRERYLGYLERPGPQQCIEELRDRLDDGQTVWLLGGFALDVLEGGRRRRVLQLDGLLGPVVAVREKRLILGVVPDAIRRIQAPELDTRHTGLREAQPLEF